MCIRDRGGLHQRSGVALPTGGRADPAVGNEALAGTRRSFFFSLVPGARWYPKLKPRLVFSTLKPRLAEHPHTQTDRFFFLDVAIRNSLRSNKKFTVRNKDHEVRSNFTLILGANF